MPCLTTYLRKKMRQMHITNTSSPSRTAAPTTPPTTAPMRTPVLVIGMGVGVIVLPETVLLPVLIVAPELVAAPELVLMTELVAVTELVVATELVPVTELVVKGLTATSGQRVSSTIPMCSDKRL